MSFVNSTDEAAPLRRQRLLADIRELTKNPYPNISLHVPDDDFTSLCLILTPEKYPPLHLTVSFSGSYPTIAPMIKMNSRVYHPNVFGTYICADILKNGDGYTPAYTLKGIAIQMLSFFSSDKVEQEDGYEIPLDRFQSFNGDLDYEKFICTKCGFGVVAHEVNELAALTSSQPLDENVPGMDRLRLSQAKPQRRRRRRRARKPKSQSKAAEDTSSVDKMKSGIVMRGCPIDKPPNEVLLLILDKIEDFEDLTSFARAWPRISRLITDFDVVRRRELQCFCTKQSYEVAKLGIGISSSRGHLSSEFDLLSKEAYSKLQVRRSIHGIPFGNWLALPISRRHWESVRGNAREQLSALKSKINPPNSSIADVLYTFMNDIVVRLNQVATEVRHNDGKSTLRHASEKAIDSYFHLFHLLVCLATEDLTIVQSANRLLMNFASGKRSKADCPNLGNLLVALLISDMPVTDVLRKAIITEAITRNVVWLLDRRGAGMAELSYMEPDAVSDYRLQKTFEGSRTSYRLLMFSELFRRTARYSAPSPSSSGGKRPLAEVREELFDRHGGPPPGAAAHLASEVRRLHSVDSFPKFLVEMGMRSIPSAESFTEVLRQTVRDSVKNGYSRWAVPQNQALALRMRDDPDVGATDKMRQWAQERALDAPPRHGASFFPIRDKQQGRGRGALTGRGTGRGVGTGRGGGH